MKVTHAGGSNPVPVDILGGVLFSVDLLAGNLNLSCVLFPKSVYAYGVYRL